MWPYYFLVASSLAVILFSGLALRRVDKLPKGCQSATRKELGLIFMWGIAYASLELRWILLKYTDRIPALDSYAWVAVEFMVMIIFFVMIGREWTCPKKMIGEFLVEAGDITETRLCEALEKQRQGALKIKLVGRHKK